MDKINKETKSKMDQYEKTIKNQNGYNIITLTFTSVTQVSLNIMHVDHLNE